ncbi:MAG TPA: aminotransferase class I/II-fold pyridoxal phosphate-dependent enzyme [Candidatus Dormibacteraeota bacterium]|nr:aminotransferase class I/II-fold pyridoxal phosphate-dependent enzyme [Candidatus Dormibacteraeota bacterium]
MFTTASAKTLRFTESVIRDMTRINLDRWGPERAINFAQGFPDFEPPPAIVEAAHRALTQGGAYHQYGTTWGAPDLRVAIAEKVGRAWGREVDPETEITVACGATESMMATMLGLIDPGDEVVIFQPFYENYSPDCILSGAEPRYVTMRAPDWTFDPDELRAAFSPRTRAIVVNTPHNPTGKVYTREELELVAELCLEHDVLAFTDEIYEHLVYEGEHVSLATLPGMADRTVTVSGASKTYSVTGWRVGWVIAPPSLSASIRKVHDFLTVGAAHPLQIAVAEALRFSPSFYDALLEEYRERREAMVSGLRDRGFEVMAPAGSYYVMAGIGGLTDLDDVVYANRLIERVGVATVPGSSFHRDRELGRGYLRFSYPKRIETIQRGMEALDRL